MIVGLSQVELLQLSVRIATVDVDACVSWHKRDGLIQNRHCLMESAFPEKAGAHIVVGEPYLDGYIVL